MVIGKKKHVCHKYCKAFSLIELLVVVVLIGLIAAIALPSLNAFMGADTKNELTNLCGFISEVYDRAALQGKVNRIVIQIKEGQYFVEEKSDEKKDDVEDKFIKVEGELGEKIKVKENISIFGVWVEGLNEPLREGEAQIYFYPGGYSQKFFISIGKKGKETPDFHVTINPLTGEIITGSLEPTIEDINESFESEE